MSHATSTQPLAGLRVLDFTSLAMGPLAGQTLGDFGADVIKVEPLAGDSFRQTLPMRTPDMGHVYLNFNRNKRSLAIDLKSPDVKEVVDKLIRSADILISNMRPSAMKKLGLDFSTVSAIKPDIIYCAAYGFSERGAYAGRPAADDTIQAMSGLAEVQGRNGEGPAFVNSIVADKVCGLVLVNSIMAAVIHRMATGRGQFIELSMFETMTAFVLPEHLAGLSYTPPMGTSGYTRVLDPYRRPYATSDGYLSVLPYTTDQWQRFFRLVGRDDLADDPDLAITARRNARISDFYSAVERVVALRTTAEWIRLLREADILFGEVLSPEDLLSDPHLAATGLFRQVDHPSEGAMTMIAPPVHFSDEMTQVRRLAPKLGEHSIELLRDLGVGEQAITDLVDAGVLKQSA